MEFGIEIGSGSGSGRGVGMGFDGICLYFTFLFYLFYIYTADWIGLDWIVEVCDWCFRAICVQISWLTIDYGS